ncbi:ParB N-terminal domain-containing protein [Pseudomonas sp. YQ_5]|uniref:ParB N-terminal domain-containing protein n=1 Tax=Pseudomonas sp. YQ_5 TaxID=3367229 RepID=UPI00370C6F4A
MSGSQIKRLTKAMEKNGFNPNHPVDVWRNPSTGRLEIQDGHHRAAAAKKRALKKFQSKFRSDVMTKQYKAAFIVPIRASRILGEDGWEFESSERLSKNFCNHLIENLRVKFIEEYCDINKYAGEGIRMSLLLDDNQEVEVIYLQLSVEALASLSEMCQSIDISSEAEFFVP